jgi:hypothetical protein
MSPGGLEIEHMQRKEELAGKLVPTRLGRTVRGKGEVWS